VVSRIAVDYCVVIRSALLAMPANLPIVVVFLHLLIDTTHRSKTLPYITPLCLLWEHFEFGTTQTQRKATSCVGACRDLALSLGACAVFSRVPALQTKESNMNNTCTLIGRVVANPVLSTTKNTQTPIAQFSLAVKDYAKKGQEQDAEFHDIKAFNGNSKRVMELLHKGREVVVVGRLTYERFTTKDGVNVKKAVILMSSFHVFGRKPDAESAEEPVEMEAREAC